MKIEDIMQNQKAGSSEEKQVTAKSSKGMAASAVKEATQAGTDILEQGGNAIDALIAMQLALAVVEGMNTGIAAGGFIAVYDAEEKDTKMINGHSKAPKAVDPDLFIDEEGEVEDYDGRTTDSKSIGVPGIMKALELAHEKYGSLPLEKLIEPAIQLAENEYEVNFLWERTIDTFHERLGDGAKEFFVPGGEKLKEGDRVKQPELAKTLKIIRDEGFKAVYEGEIAEAIVRTAQNRGGLITMDDMRNYQAKIDDPLWSTYRGFELAVPNPPNGGGFAVAQMLKILEGFDISRIDPKSWEKYHLLAETMRLTLADMHEHIEDPRFKDIPLEGLLDPRYIEERRSLLSFDRRMDKVEAGDPWKYQEGKSRTQIMMEVNESMETTHFTAVDKWGNVAACTSSIERIFGTGDMVPGYGFLLNNDLTDFNPEPGAVNEPDSHKYAVSAKAPTIIFDDGKPFLTLGSPGAKTIVASVLQVILNVIDYKMDLKQAIREPRIYTTPDESNEWQDGIPDEALEKLDELGYHADQEFKSITADDRIGDVQAILIDQKNGQLYGAADSPRPGQAAGPGEAPSDN